MQPFIIFAQGATGERLRLQARHRVGEIPVARSTHEHGGVGLVEPIRDRVVRVASSENGFRGVVINESIRPLVDIPD